MGTFSRSGPRFRISPEEEHADGLHARPDFFSFWALAAHALRGGEIFLCASLAAWPLLLATRKAAARRICAAALLAGALFWIRTGIGLLRLRAALGEPRLRLGLILGATCLAALAAALWLSGARATALFPREAERQRRQSGAFLLTAGLLAAARTGSALPVLLADRFLPGSGWAEILLLALYAARLAGRMADPAAHARLRPRIWLLFSIAFFAQLALGLFLSPKFLMTGRLHPPVPALIAAGPLYRGGGCFMPILFAATVLLVGPAWCSHLCYVGAWDDRCSRRKSQKPRRLGRGWTIGGRSATLALACCGALGLRSAGVAPVAAAWFAGGFGLLGVGVMLVVSRRLGCMAHCAAFCPIGLLGNLLGRLAPWRMRIDAGACTHCGACARTCRYSALGEAEIAAGHPGLSCTLCGDCVAACGHAGAMDYRCARLDPETARALFSTLIAALHAVFLGVARI